MPKEKPFSIRLDADTLKELLKIAKRDDRSLAYVIREACKEYVKKGKQ